MLEFCTTLPFSVQRMDSECGSLISSDDTIAGPMGAKVSKDLPVGQ